MTVASRPPLQLSKQQEDSSLCTKTQRQTVALPLHVQTLQRALNLDRLINQVEKVLDESLETSRDGYEALKSTKSLLSQASADSSSRSSNNKRRKTQLYNFSHVTEERKWVQVRMHEKISSYLVYCQQHDIVYMYMMRSSLFLYKIIESIYWYTYFGVKLLK